MLFAVVSGPLFNIFEPEVYFPFSTMSVSSNWTAVGNRKKGLQKYPHHIHTDVMEFGISIQILIWNKLFCKVIIHQFLCILRRAGNENSHSESGCHISFDRTFLKKSTFLRENVAFWLKKIFISIKNNIHFNSVSIMKKNIQFRFDWHEIRLNSSNLAQISTTIRLIPVSDER